MMSSLFKNFFEKSQSDNKPGKIEYIGKEPTSDEQVKISVKIYGQVQGVGFRFSTKQAADQLGVGGIVRNENDGSVYVEANGTKEQINQLIDTLAKGPSPAATVDRIVVEYDNSIEERTTFSQTDY